MPSNDWTLAPFVKVFTTLPDDRPDVYDDDALLANWLRLLLTARGAFPGSAELPRDVPDDVVSTLVALEVIDVKGHRFRFHGLAREADARARRAAANAAGGRARAATATRDGGRFAPTSDPTSDVAGNAGDLNGHDDDAAGTSVVDQRAARQPTSVRKKESTDTYFPNGQYVSVDDPTSDVAGNAGDDRNPPRPVARVPDDVNADPPGANPCKRPDVHTAEFRYYIGVGWRCPECDADADRGETFTDKVRKLGGWVPGDANGGTA